MNRLFKQSVEGALRSAEKIADPLEQTKMYIEIAKLTKDMEVEVNEVESIDETVTENNDTLENEFFKNIDKIRQPVLLEFIYRTFFNYGIVKEGCEKLEKLYRERLGYIEAKTNEMRKECINEFDNRTKDIKVKMDNGIDDQGLVEEIVNAINIVREKKFEIDILEGLLEEPTLSKIDDYTINLKKKPGIRGNEFCIKDIRTRSIDELREFIEQGLDWQIDRMRHTIETYEEEQE